MGFTCQEGSEIGGGSGTADSGFDCTVVPDDGKTCDVSTTSVVCYKSATPAVTFVPTKGVCLNVGHKPGTDDNDNDDHDDHDDHDGHDHGTASSAPTAAAVGVASA